MLYVFGAGEVPISISGHSAARNTIAHTTRSVGTVTRALAKLKRGDLVRVEGPIRALRRLIYCGEWIESHVLHIYMLHAPDFRGYERDPHGKDHRELCAARSAIEEGG